MKEYHWKLRCKSNKKNQFDKFIKEFGLVPVTRRLDLNDILMVVRGPENLSQIIDFRNDLRFITIVSQTSTSVEDFFNI